MTKMHLLSKELDNVIDESQFDQIDEFESKYVYITLYRLTEPKIISGLLRSVLFDCTNPRFEFKTDLTVALHIAHNYLSEQFSSIEIEHNETKKIFSGSFSITSAEISDIDVQTQTCVLSLVTKCLVDYI